MNKKLSFLLLFSAMMICFTVFQAQAASISFNILDSYIETSESFDVAVYVQEDASAGDLTAFGFDVDPLGSLTLFSYNGYTIGPDYTDTGVGNYVAGLNWFNPNAGNNVLLATLSFTAGLTAGTDTLSIGGLVDSFFTHGLYYEFSEEEIASLTDIEIHESSLPVPEPATMWLLGTGIIGLAGFGRKKCIS
jgi:hypothetical protein